MTCNITVLHSRALRITGALILILLLTLPLTACSGESADADKSGGAVADSETPTMITTSAELQAAIDSEFANETWYANIASVAVEQQLLTPVAVITIDLEADASGPAYDIAREIPVAISPLLEDSIPNVAIMSGPSGIQMSGSGMGQSFEQADLGLPAAPTNAPELEAWLNEVFADSGEAWYSHLTTIELLDPMPGYSSAGVIAHTDLTGSGADAVNKQPATLIRMAISMSGQAFAENVSVVNASGENLSSGSLPPVTHMYLRD